jgi:ABC-type Mn2+/Zn2+ transport system permease subunit
MLSYGFAQRALAGGLIIALACSLLSFFVVVRRMAFVGMGISHAAFGGVAVGLVTGLDPLLAAGGFCTLVALGIGALKRGGRVHEDTAIGIIFAAAMALGVVLVRAADAYNLDLMSYLFGSILSLGWRDVAIIGAVGATAAVYTALFFKELLFLSFDPETAEASGLPVRTVYYSFLVILALVIVVSIKLVGIILVSALLVVPGAGGLQLCRNYRGVLAAGSVLGSASVVVGLYLSYRFDVASGACIVLVLFAFFLLCLIASPRRWRREREATREIHRPPAAGMVHRERAGKTG